MYRKYETYIKKFQLNGKQNNLIIAQMKVF